ncbi:hypothetical protein [Azotosporobacter soli]|uniref:hypothetical protein n=1 Tax=Azotosporobacter soli TaxID=3055040 RepID=UPI0031FF21FA
MTKKSTERGREPREKNTQVYVDELYFRHVDQIERWRQEHEHSKAVEAKLQSVSDFEYEPIDYAPLLEKEPWIEPPRTDFSSLIPEARIAVENKYYTPLVTRAALAMAALFCLIIFNNPVILWTAGIAVFAIVGWTYWTISQRQNAIREAIEGAKIEIARREGAEQRLIDEQRTNHDVAEEDRIQVIQKLVDGEISAVFAKLDAQMITINFPFPLTVDVELCKNIPSMQVWFPPKTIIPKQTSELQPSGRPIYTDKEMRAINKQYVELCAAILMQVACFVFANIPSFQTLYLSGMSKENANNECLIAMRLERETFEAVARLGTTPLIALQRLQANFANDTSLDFIPIPETKPEEWGDMEQQFVRALKIKLFK